MSEYAKRLLYMIERKEVNLAHLRKQKGNYIPALIAETENGLSALRRELERTEKA